MLLKRVDVTIDSFLWGGRGKDRRTELLAAVDVQRKHLLEGASKYSVSGMWLDLISCVVVLCLCPLLEVGP